MVSGVEVVEFGFDHPQEDARHRLVSFHACVVRFLHTGVLQARRRRPGTFDQGDGEMTLNPQDEPTINLPFKYASHNLGKRLHIVQHSLAVVFYGAGTQNLKLEGEV